jgi:hypothetical protein
VLSWASDSACGPFFAAVTLGGSFWRPLFVDIVPAYSIHTPGALSHVSSDVVSPVAYFAILAAVRLLDNIKRWRASNESSRRIFFRKEILYIISSEHFGWIAPLAQNIHVRSLATCSHGNCCLQISCRVVSLLFLFVVSISFRLVNATYQEDYD